MKDIVVGAITGYNFDQIKPWVNSLDRSGFDGTKMMLCYDVSFDVAEELAKRNYTVIAFGKDESSQRFTYKHDFAIVVERFLHLWYCLRKLEGEYRFIVATDVKDVVFQKNPSEWLECNLHENNFINASCESIRYKDEPWGQNNITKAFGVTVYDQMKDNLIYNCGVLSGRFKTMIDLFQNIYMMSNGTSHQIEGGGGPDQAALNIILNMQPWKNVTKFTNSEEAWAAQLGTTGPQVVNKTVVTEPTPLMIGDMVCTSVGTPYSIVHQYDRIPQWKKIIEEKYA